ncbi:unnamed protein product [Caenorhabditis angaria]|uniref:Uncharacterized protein n=1 Tax=Caenorhabditis angaria TaxID=860376 RepID=A0A9P1J5U7_9PELO|nr:unnamed protein product [Caenorhabditis angaria]
MKLLVLIIFAFAISPTSALIRTVLMDYWQQIEKEIQPTDNQYNLFIFSEYSEDRRIVRNHAKSNETSLTVIIHENHWLRLKIVCGNSSEPMLLEMQAAYRHLHLVVDCDSFQAVLYPHRKYVRGALIVFVVLLVAILVWKREVIRTLITDRYRKSRQKFAIFKNEPEDGQDVNLA